MRTCDRCGKAVSEDLQNLEIRQLIEVGYDLCDKCEDKLKIIINDFIKEAF